MNEKSQVYQCAECGWKSSRNVGVCPICHGSLELVAAATPQSTNSSNTFSLTSLFLVLTLICVGVGAIVSQPGIGIPFVFISALALARTRADLSKSASGRGSRTAGDRIASFAGSFAIVFLISIAGVIAFQIACWASCFGLMVIGGRVSSIVIGIGLGGVAGFFAIVHLLHKTWPRRK